VVKHVDEVEVRIVAAAVLAAAADAVLVAHHLPKLGAHLVTAGLLKNSLEAGSTRDKKGGGGGGGGDAAAAGENQLGSCTAGKVKYTALCVQW